MEVAKEKGLGMSVGLAMGNCGEEYLPAVLCPSSSVPVSFPSSSPSHTHSFNPYLFSTFYVLVFKT